MKLSIALPKFEAQFNRGVMKELRAYLNKSMLKAVPAIKTALSVQVFEIIASSDEYESLVNGQLRGEIGLEDSTLAQTIIEHWADSIIVSYDKGKPFGRIKISMIESDYSDVLSLPAAEYFYTSANGSGRIEWLRWLLLEGSSVIVRDFDFVLDSRRGTSRTGMGVMAQQRGGGWEISPRFAGTLTDNFVTRSLQEIDKVIEIVVEKEVNRVL